ncbi:MAG: glycosyltransferase family 4 protein [Bacteroidetes bacterium]|nr:glycosyltransferase family 4 protein [Bacteroidota bacterium]
MKILIIHNNYTIRGGEESVVIFQKNIFEKLGHEVLIYSKDNKVKSTFFNKLKRLFLGYFNPFSYNDIQKITKDFKPDFAIIHNLYHSITPSVLLPLKKANIPSFMILHNYRLLCPVGTLFRNGAICKDCLDSPHREVMCLKNRCGKTLANSFFFASRSKLIRKSKLVTKNITTFVALSPFQKNVLVKYGIDSSKIEVIGNAIDIDEKTIVDFPKEDYIGYIGRMTPEKGIDLFIEIALSMPEQKFKIAGINSLDNNIKLPKNVEMCGYLTKENLAKFYSSAKSIMMTSKCYEGFPMVILEAFKYKTPVIVPHLGALADIVTDNFDGYVYEPTDIKNLISRIKKLTFEQSKSMGENGFLKAVNNYNAVGYANKIIKLAIKNKQR